MTNRGSSSRRLITAIAIGPVQEFIATARRTRDLWAGSYILSETAKAAAQAILDRGGELIFPDATIFAVAGSSAPNKILAIINDEATIHAAVDRARDRLTELARESGGVIKGKLDNTAYFAQIGDLLEVFWALVPFDGLDYAQARRDVEGLLAARKATRDFRPPSWSGPVLKCSLDGQREAVITESEYATSHEILRRRFGTKRGERLCGVCLMKRNLPLQGDRFLSTSEIAGRTYLAGANHKARSSPSIASALSDYARKASRNTTGALLYAERLEEEVEPEALESAKDALKTLVDTVGIGPPSPYFALLQADGDGMGEFLNSIDDKESHQRLSRRLGEFAVSARTLVEANSGALVYAGGDDVLAFLPLHLAIECGRALNVAFSELLRDALPGRTTPTLSVGIALVHHLEPLSDALELVRQAERSAKSVPGKNGLTVVLSKRSGGDRFATGKWGTIDLQLGWLIDLFQAEQISAGTPYEILRALERFNPRPEVDDLPQALQGPFRVEVSRILARKRATHGTEDVDPRILASLTAMVAASADPAAMANLMIIAQFLAEGRRLSQVETPLLDDIADHPPEVQDQPSIRRKSRESSTRPIRTDVPDGSESNVWIVEPRDRFVARDGRPFNAVPGSRATSLPWPYPSTTTGGVRTRAGLDTNGVFDESRIAEVKKIEVRGPFLVALSTGGEIDEWLAPAPADALLLPSTQDGCVSTRRLVPLKLGHGGIDGTTNLEGLTPVGLLTSDPRKPYASSPRWWYWEYFEKWLIDSIEEEIAVAAIGNDGPLKDRRTHVSIDPNNQASVEGALFETRALVFSNDSRERFAMAVATDAAIKPGAGLLGGERRMVSWRRSTKSCVQLPAELVRRIDEDRHCRLIFLTPAFFPTGFPSATELPHGLEIVAAALPRHHVVSGWNFETSLPKPARRLIPAGSVFFMKCAGGSDWVEKQWLKPFGGDQESMNDGFGVVAIGTWRPA